MRKIKEAFLAIRIEQLLNKDEILELYLNKIYLGYRAYGVGAAAQVYFGKPIDQLTLSEMAVIAGLPKAPSTFNPLYSMDRATARRNVVLSRMLSEGYITQAQYDEARSEAIDASYHAPKIAFSAPYLSEMVRQEMVNRYGEQAYEDGYRVYTTITRKNQQAAQQAVRNNVLDYDMRHGYRGPASVLWKVGETPWGDEENHRLAEASVWLRPAFPGGGHFRECQEAVALLANGDSVSLTMDGVRWARRFISDTQQGRPRVKSTTSCRPGSRSGFVKWLTAGGCHRSRTSTQRWSPLIRKTARLLLSSAGLTLTRASSTAPLRRCVRSAPTLSRFLYTAAMDKGLTLASMLNDVPISRWDAGAGSDWRPKNSPPQYAGPIRLRQGLDSRKTW